MQRFAKEKIEHRMTLAHSNFLKEEAETRGRLAGMKRGLQQEGKVTELFAFIQSQFKNETCHQATCSFSRNAHYIPYSFMIPIRNITDWSIYTWCDA